MSKLEDVPSVAPGLPQKPPPPGEPEQKASKTKAPKEIGGPPGPEPTRYGDWQYKGRCTDF